MKILCQLVVASVLNQYVTCGGSSSLSDHWNTLLFCLLFACGAMENSLETPDCIISYESSMYGSGGHGYSMMPGGNGYNAGAEESCMHGCGMGLLNMKGEYFKVAPSYICDLLL